MRFNIYKHVANTWLLGLLTNYSIFIVWGIVIDRDAVNNEFLGMMAVLVIALLVMGIPALFISLIFFRLIMFSPLRRPGMALIAWCGSIIMSVALEATVPCVLVLDIIHELLYIIIPGAIAGVIAALLRWQQFYKLFLFIRHQGVRPGPDNEALL